MSLTLVRHAASEGNAAHKLSNKGDFSLRKLIEHKSPSELRLIDEGLSQAACAGNAILSMGIEFDVIATSPMLRAIETSLVATDILGYRGAPIVDDLLRERSWGVHDYLTVDKKLNDRLWKERAQYTHTDWSPEGGETYTAIMMRAQHLIDKYMIHRGQGQDEHHAVLFTHGELIMHIERALLGHNNASHPRMHAMEEVPCNCSVRQWQIDPISGVIRLRTNSKEDLSVLGKWAEVPRVNLTRDDLWEIVNRGERIIT